MRILLIAINYWPELTGIGKYTGEMAEWLAQKGSEVRVITAPPYYPAWRVGAGHSGWRYRRERLAGVDILRCPFWVPSRPTGLKRVLHLASFALTAMPAMLWSGLRWKPDCVFVVEPPLFCAPAALLTARLAGGIAWLHVQDFEVDAAFDLGILRVGWLRRWVLATERWLMRRFDVVSTISDRMLARLRDKGVKAEKGVLFPNWVDTGSIHPLSGTSRLRSELGIDAKKFVALYSGNMGEKQGLETIIAAARLLESRPDLLFVLCGDGAARARLVDAARGLQNVMFIPLQPLERLNQLLNMADVHLLPQRVDAEDLVMPSKLTAMMASGRPVVATAYHDSQVELILRQRGLVVEPGDAAAIAEAVVRLYQHPDEWLHLGEAARAYAVDVWDRDEVLKTVSGKIFSKIRLN
jgi:colanic acid biosynthesis glycosyl transferase WcaI